MAQQERRINTLALEVGGVPAGEANGERGYMLTFVIAYIRVSSFVTDYMWVSTVLYHHLYVGHCLYHYRKGNICLLLVLVCIGVDLIIGTEFHEA